ncbi:MAG: hypothetical protein U0872_03935 [Planctomycetaceae bacterium]
MSGDFSEDDKPRPKRTKPAKKSGMSVAMILLIIIGSLAGLSLVACCGIGGAGVFMFQQAVKEADLTSPADIQRVTSEITDITIPPEFVPKHASSIMLIKLKRVEYEWCPTGTCPARTDGLGTMTLTAMDLQQPNQPQLGQSDIDVSDEALKQTWRNYTKTDHEFPIRGRNCRFTIVQGEQLGFVDVEESEMEAEPGDASPDAGGAEGKAETPGAATEETVTETMVTSIPPRKQVQISGDFPAKNGECTLLIQLAPEDYDEAKILEMLKSIR